MRGEVLRLSFSCLVVAVAASWLVMVAASSCLAADGESATDQQPLAYVTVAGAPGDGEEALAAALSRQLAARGIKPATTFQANVYEVQGTVKMAPAARGKQSVTIVWVVLGPDGTQLGITRQTKDVRKGSLDRKWGGAAEAAAAAAAADIVNLLPRQISTPGT
jgi:hypothetical protein